MSRWSTPGEAHAYETGYIEGMAEGKRWIPVTERLPLVSYDKYGNHSSDPVIICMESGEVEIGWFNPSGLFERCRCDELDIIGSIADGAVDYMHVVAWMPLPEPWKGEGDE